MGRKLEISEEEIKVLGRRIKKAVRKLTGIDQILQETESDLSMIEKLREQAIQAKCVSIHVLSQYIVHTPWSGVFKSRTAERSCVFSELTYNY